MMIEMQVDIVDDMTAEVALKPLPHHLQELVVTFDPESTVCAGRYKNRIAHKNQPKVYYKDGKVS
jgi:hypothetical protein